MAKQLISKAIKICRVRKNIASIWSVNYEINDEMWLLPKTMTCWWHFDQRKIPNANKSIKKCTISIKTQSKTHCALLYCYPFQLIFWVLCLWPKFGCDFVYSGSRRDHAAHFIQLMQMNSANSITKWKSIQMAFVIDLVVYDVLIKNAFSHSASLSVMKCINKWTIWIPSRNERKQGFKAVVFRWNHDVFGCIFQAIQAFYWIVLQSGAEIITHRLSKHTNKSLLIKNY